MFFPRSVPASSPIFPEPISVPGCVNDEKYRVCNAFILRSINGYAITSIWLAAWFFASPLSAPDVGLWTFLIGLLVLSAIRPLAHGSLWDPWLSLPILAVSLVGLAQALHGMTAGGWPANLIFVPSICAWGYARVARGDFSFAGLFTLGTLSSWLILLGPVVSGHQNFGRFAIEAATTAAFMLFITYDLAMILRRRRKDELLASIPDIYRDLLNFITYPFRIFAHWRRFLAP